MHYPVAMKVIKALKNLLHHILNVFLLKHDGCVSDQFFKICNHILQGHIDSLAHVKHIIQANYIWVVQLLEQLYFSQCCEWDSFFFLKYDHLELMSLTLKEFILTFLMATCNYAGLPLCSWSFY